MIPKEEISSWFRALQDEICKALEAEDGKSTFAEDNWQREGGGGGRTRILQKGNVIEKGGVNFSEVFSPPTPQRGEHSPHASLLEGLLTPKSPPSGGGGAFYATGVSIVMHPQSPMVPIIHMNIRYFESGNDKWFGGGIDLTPHYVNEEDAKHFHQTLKSVCDRHHTTYYHEFKKWADEYFFIKHRNETRGIGGIFFDHLAAPPPPKGGSNSHKEQSNDDLTKNLTDLPHPASGGRGAFDFVKDVGSCFALLYVSLMKKNKSITYTEREKQWQYLRRGRYVEFNLVYDRGTKFGLETNGRTESILMSLPPQANWAYDYEPEKGCEEEKTLGYLKKGIDWSNYKL